MQPTASAHAARTTSRFDDVHVERSRNVRRLALELALIAGVVTVALVARFHDPLSSHVMATEDPFTHLVFTREHMARGYLADSFHMGTTLYPPGMHVALGIWWSIAGVDLYSFMSHASPMFGAFAVAGAYVLGSRFGGPAAGVTAGIVTALIPEHIVRTDAFFPTALDLAAVPFFLWALMEAAETRGAARFPWLAVAGTIGLALTFAHPWVIPLTAIPVALYLVARALTLPSEERNRALASSGAVIALGGALVAIALKSRWHQSGSGFADFGQTSQNGMIFDTMRAVLNPWFLLVAAVGVAGIVLLARRWPLAARLVACVAIGVELWITLPILAAFPPPLVDYPRQLGTVAITLAIAGAVTFPLWLENRLTLMGAMLAIVTFPLTAVNVFQSSFLPHRTVAYLAIAVGLLAGGFVATIAHLLTRESRASPLFADIGLPRGSLAHVAASCAVAFVIAGAMLTPAEAKAETWYRYYTDEEFGAFDHARAILADQGNALVLSGDWRPNMALKALSPELGRVWYSEEYFSQDSVRHEWNHRASAKGATLYVVVDGFEEQRYGKAGWTSGGWTPAWTCTCGTIALYRAPPS